MRLDSRRRESRTSRIAEVRAASARPLRPRWHGDPDGAELDLWTGFRVRQRESQSGARPARAAGSLGLANPTAPAHRSNESPEEAKEVQFVSFVLDTAEATWAKSFRTTGTPWQNAKLVLFRDATQTGAASARRRWALLLSRRSEAVHRPRLLRRAAPRFGAPGEFAQAYVLTHELGHHVQHLLGIDAAVRRCAAARPAARERSLGATRAAGGLLRRRVGPRDSGRGRSSKPEISSRA